MYYVCRLDLHCNRAFVGTPACRVRKRNNRKKFRTSHCPDTVSQCPYKCPVAMQIEAADVIHTRLGFN